MKSEDEVQKAMELAETMGDRLDDGGYHMEAMAPEIIQVALRWVLDDDADTRDLLEELKEDVKETDE